MIRLDRLAIVVVGLGVVGWLFAPEDTPKPAAKMPKAAVALSDDGTETDTYWRRDSKINKEKYDAETQCRNDATCYFGKFEIAATVACSMAVEDRARFEFEWTNSIFKGTRKFYKIATWADKESGSFVIGGDEIRFKNGFGVWQRMNYLCSYNPDIKKEEVLSISEGRLGR